MENNTETSQKLKNMLRDQKSPFLVYTQRKQNHLEETSVFLCSQQNYSQHWKQPKQPLTDERIKKIRYKYTVEYYSSLKKKEGNPIICNVDDLENIVLSEIRQREKEKKTHVITYT